MIDVTNVRGADEYNALNEQLDEILDSVFEKTKKVAEEFFTAFAANPDPKILAAGLEPRAWRHLESLYVLNEGIRRYSLTFQRKHIAMMAKKSHQHAQHYVMIGRLIESLGGTVPASTPEVLQPWSKFLWESLDRHPLAAIAAAHCSEVSATGSFYPVLAAGEQHDFNELVEVFHNIETHETFFHIGLARQILASYTKTEEDASEVLRAARGMHDIAWQNFIPESVMSQVKHGAIKK